MVGKAGSESGGIEVRQHDCVVFGVRLGGLIGYWNNKYPDYSVSVGDRIIQVNGVRGAAGIHAEFPKRQQFWMWLRKAGAPEQSAASQLAVPDPDRSSVDGPKACHLHLGGSPPGVSRRCYTD